MALVKKSQHASHKAELMRLIDKLRNKLSDPSLTEKQYKAIEGVLLNKLKALKDQQYQSEVDNVRKQQEDAQKAAAKQLEDLKTEVYKVEKLFDELPVSKTMQDKVYSLMTKPVTTLDNGVAINALQKHQLENPVDFNSKLYYMYLITDGFKNMNQIVHRASTKAVNTFKAKLEKSNFIGTSQSNPSFHEDITDRPIITDIIDD